MRSHVAKHIMKMSKRDLLEFLSEDMFDLTLEGCPKSVCSDDHNLGFYVFSKNQDNEFSKFVYLDDIKNHFERYENMFDVKVSFNGKKLTIKGKS